LVQDVDLNSQIQNSVYIVILARGSSYGTIEQALKNKIQVVDNATRREELQQQLADYRNSSKFDRDKVMALTNLLGDWRLVFLPHYGEVGSIDRGTLNQTAKKSQRRWNAQHADRSAWTECNRSDAAVDG
jgi:plasmid maintenance system killer protein